MAITRLVFLTLLSLTTVLCLVGCGSAGQASDGSLDADVEPDLIGTHDSGAQGYAYVPIGASQTGGGLYSLSPCPLGDRTPAPVGTPVTAGSASGETDYLGFFSLDGLGEGRYDLTIGKPQASGGLGQATFANAIDIRRPAAPGFFDIRLEPVTSDESWPEALRFVHTVEETEGGGVAFAVCPPGEGCIGASFQMRESLPQRALRFRFHALSPSPTVGTEYPFQLASGSAAKWGAEVLFGSTARWVLRPGITVAGQTIAPATGGWTFTHVVTTADGRLVGTFDGEVNALLAADPNRSAKAVERAARVRVTGQFDLPLIRYTKPRGGADG